MGSEQIVSFVIHERDKLDRAIKALQGPKLKGPTTESCRRASGNKRCNEELRWGRNNGQRTFTAAQRKQQAERMKRYWAEKRKAAKK